MKKSKPIRRRKIYGTNERPRLSVFRSINHIYAQIIDDEKGRTIASASTVEKDIRKKFKQCNIETAKAIGEEVAKRAVKAGVKKVVFDRGDYLYHGKIKALADAARAQGLEF